LIRIKANRHLVIESLAALRKRRWAATSFRALMYPLLDHRQERLLFAPLAMGPPCVRPPRRQYLVSLAA
jgi:hypothetical protein